MMSNKTLFDAQASWIKIKPKAMLTIAITFCRTAYLTSAHFYLESLRRVKSKVAALLLGNSFC